MFHRSPILLCIVAATLLSACNLFRSTNEQTTPDAATDMGGDAFDAPDMADGPMWTLVAVGGSHSCGVRDAQLYCWGRGAEGQLGNGVLDERTTPFPVTTTSVFRALTLGDSHSCGLTDDDALFCWGSGSATGPTESAIPVQIDGTWKHVAAGRLHTCAIADDDSVHCWGDNGLGALGRDGADSTSTPTAIDGLTAKDIGAGAGITCILDLEGQPWCWGRQMALGESIDEDELVIDPSPVAYPSLVPLQDLVVGRDHACALDVEGNVFCWGSAPLVAELSGNPDPNPRQISAGPFSQMSAGGRCGCGIDEEGTVICFGSNYRGRIGIGSDDSGGRVYEPQPIAAGQRRFTQVAQGNSHGCAVGADGELMCWGQAHDGKLGNGMRGYVDTPKLIETDVEAAEVVAGDYHICVRATDGSVHCAGRASYNALGLGDSGHQNTITEVPGVNLAELFASFSKTCGIAADGSATCWGGASVGELGTGSDDGANLPTPVAGNLEFDNSMALGNSHGCANIVGGGTACWGDSDFIGMDVGDQNEPLVIDPMIFTEDFVQLVAGYHHTCGRTAAGDAFCWGSGADGVLGSGSNTNSRLAPVQVQATAFSHLTGWGPFTCGIVADGEGVCWGRNGGALGFPTDTNRNTPQPIDGGHSWRVLSAERDNACGITLDDELYCWGLNGSGQLGIGTRSDRVSPTKVDLPDGVVPATVAAGGSHTCVTTSENELYCWGLQTFGRLGDGIDSIISTPDLVADPE